ncbi:Ig-like domain-containing protein [Ferrimonas lipolytica]|uniref:Cadherin-like domain-containing protein n=1 Tax=Ferrimonas lipolytica TaxID=2724191 RepID=A0A6H1UF51_9GAMM|nr:Ig-like domain-containing protein [Ferrimonas lipolytica]QIZ77725.1 cadherin-like domain-containing protein [Ferrimonas lipolytica]
MKTQYRLLATLIAATLLGGCSDDDNNDNDVIVPTNTAPVVANATSTTTSSTAVMIDVMSAASDADGDELTLTTAVAKNGKATIVNGQIQYHPQDYVGDDTIDFEVSDGTDSTAAIVTVTVSKEEVVLSYVGSESCQSCHAAEYETHQLSGHNFKISKVSDGTQVQFPYSDVTGGLQLVRHHDDNGNEIPTMNSLGAPDSYDDVTYTTGGYWKKIRWFDANGHIVTGDAVQYNLEGSADNQQMSGYHADDVDMIYDCGNCHNTGWRPFSSGSYEHRQDDLPGMGGDFAYAGVQCEACHGAGSAHISAPSKTNITKSATARTTELLQSETMGYGAAMHCAECHTRDGNRAGGDLGNNYLNGYKTAFPEGEEFGGRIAAKGGLTRHHQTHDEFMGIDPASGETTNPHYNAGMSCASCHNPHKSTVNQDSADGKHSGAVKQCSDCHSSIAFNSGMVGLHASFECTDCHMPEVVKNATSKVTSAGVTFGDEMTHVVTIDLYNDKSQLTDDGKYMNPFLKDAWACGECHAEGSKLQSLTDNYGGKIHQ